MRAHAQVICLELKRVSGPVGTMSSGLREQRESGSFGEQPTVGRLRAGGSGGEASERNQDLSQQTEFFAVGSNLIF